MSLDYYLFCREKYGYILKYLEGIDVLYDDVIKETNDSINLIEDKYYKIFLMDPNDNSLYKMKEKVIKLKDICDKKIRELCQHEFVDDLIDINPERSEHITYCKICEYTK